MDFSFYVPKFRTEEELNGHRIYVEDVDPAELENELPEELPGAAEELDQLDRKNSELLTEVDELEGDVDTLREQVENLRRR